MSSCMLSIYYMYDLQRCAGLTLPAVSWLARRSLGHSGLAPWLFPVSGQMVVDRRNRKPRGVVRWPCHEEEEKKRKTNRAGTVVITDAWAVETCSASEIIGSQWVKILVISVKTVGIMSPEELQLRLQPTYLALAAKGILA